MVWPSPKLGAGRGINRKGHWETLGPHGETVLSREAGFPFLCQIIEGRGTTFSKHFVYVGGSHRLRLPQDSPVSSCFLGIIFFFFFYFKILLLILINYLLNFIIIFFCLHQVLFAACRIFSLHFGMWNLSLQHVESSSLTRNWTWAPGIGSAASQPLDHQGRLPLE